MHSFFSSYAFHTPFMNMRSRQPLPQEKPLLVPSVLSAVVLPAHSNNPERKPGHMGKWIILGGLPLAVILLMSFCVLVTVSGNRALSSKGLPGGEQPSSQQMPGLNSPYVPLARLAASNAGLPPD